MKFTSHEFNAFRADVDKALLAVADKYALTISAEKVTYTTNSFTVKLECTKTDAGDLKQKEFAIYCASYGFAKEDYMREFSYEGVLHTLVGFAPRSPKYPCICTSQANGQHYKMTVDAVKQCFKS